jgi:translation initiation factor 1 (eIF-1/SUI1)
MLFSLLLSPVVFLPSESERFHAIAFVLSDRYFDSTTYVMLYDYSSTRRIFIISRRGETHNGSGYNETKSINRGSRGMKHSATTVVRICKRTMATYQVKGSKKGGLPVTAEKRNKGKHVTVVGNVTGDASALLLELKQALGAGGQVVSSSGNGFFQVEIQGEVEARVKAYLTNRAGDSLHGVSQKAIGESAPKKKNENGKNQQQQAGGREQPTPSIDPRKVIDSKAIKSMNATALKAELKARGLDIIGNKKELVARLLAANE